MGRYQLRYAAGAYWLLDMAQSGHPYKQPLAMNECGAYIIRQLQEGALPGRLAQSFAKRYGISERQATKDVGAFLAQLEREQIEICKEK